jgi:hypothetical protein
MTILGIDIRHFFTQIAPMQPIGAHGLPAACERLTGSIHQLQEAPQ